MQKTKDELYDLIKDLKSKKEFIATIKKRYQDYDGLFDEDTLALILVDELGRNQQSITPIAHIRPDMECTVLGKITAIQQPKTFTKKNGSAGKVMNMELSDETGSCRLVLWNEDTELRTQLNVGTQVKLINGYVKNGFSGIEINLGRWGMLEIQPERTQGSTTSETKKKHGTGITGVLMKREPTRAFFKDNGEFGFVTTITIKDKKNNEKHITLWGELVKGIQQFKIGDTICISGLHKKQYNGKTEFHLNSDSTIQKI